MITHETYQKMLGETILGRARKSGSDMIMDATFKGDIQYMIGYFYDYYHDDEPLIYKNLNSENSISKTPIEVKFIVHGHNTENKDQVGYHIQFRTDQQNPIDYYEEYEKKWDCEFPIGLYVDLPDEKKIYRKWLVTERSDWLGLQFPTWYILPVDYIYQWVYQSKDGDRYKYQMCGVQRSQSSYNSGVWEDYKIETIENQRKAILPMNDISSTIFYNQRLIISAPIPEPICWRITKMEDVSPKGVRRLTFAQDIFNQHFDYIEKDENGYVIGMYADYFKSSINPEDGLPSNDNIPFVSTISKITYSGNINKIKIGGSKVFTVSFYDEDSPIEHDIGEWSFYIEGQNVIDQLEITYPSPEKVKVRIPNDDNLIGKILSVVNSTSDGIVSSVDVELIAL